jgi:hypothetical protein
MFDDDSGDEEFMSSLAQAEGLETSQPEQM